MKWANTCRSGMDFALLSLDTRSRRKAAKYDYHGYKVFGTAVIEDAETRKKIVSAF